MASTLAIGGQERQLHLLLSHLDRRRFAPEVLVWSYLAGEHFEAPIRALGVPIHGLDRGTPLPLKLVRARRLVGRLRPRVVQSYAFPVNFAVWWATAGREILAVGAVRSTLRNYSRMWSRWLVKVNCRWPGRVICNSHLAGQECRDLGRPFSPAHVEVVPNALDLGAYAPRPPLEAPPGRIVALGRLIDSKCWPATIRALAELRSRGHGVRLTLAGDGPLRAPLERLVADQGLGEAVDLPGFVDDVPGLLRGACLLVHTSVEEGQPNAVLEAMGAGVPVVAVDSGDVRRIVEDGSTGFIVPPNDAAALVGRIEELLRDPGLAARMGRAARARAEADLSPENLVERTIEAYRKFGWVP